MNNYEEIKYNYKKCLEELVEILKQKTKDLNREIRINGNDVKLLEIEKIINELRENPTCLLEYENDKLVEILMHSDDLENLEKFLKKLNALRTSFKYGDDLYEDEIKSMNELIEKLELGKKEYAKRVSYRNDSLKTYHNKYDVLYDQLINPNSSEELIDSEFALELFKDSNVDIFHVAETLYKTQETIADKLIGDERKKVDLIEMEDIGEVARTSKERVSRRVNLIDEEQLRNAFKSRGLDYDSLPNRYKLSLRKGSWSKINDILGMIFNVNDLAFLRTYGVASPTKTKEVLKSEQRLLCSILKSADIDVLNHLIVEANKPESIQLGLNLYKIIKRVPGVFKHASGHTLDGGNPGPGPGSDGEEDDLNVNGSYENYVKNRDFFIKLGKTLNQPNIFKDVLEHCPYCLGGKNDNIIKNIALSRHYGLSIIDSYTGRFCSGTALMTAQFENDADRLIEFDLYNYLKNYRSILANGDQDLSQILYGRKNGKIKFDDFGRIVGGRRKIYATENEMADFFATPSIDELVARIPDKYHEIASQSSILNPYQVDNVIALLDEKFRLENSPIYVIGDINVSRNKVLRIWNSIKEKFNNSDEQEFIDIIMYAITYNSLYNEEEYEKLRSIVTKSFGIGGY